jgi:hypothetical protein
MNKSLNFQKTTLILAFSALIAPIFAQIPQKSKIDSLPINGTIKKRIAHVGIGAVVGGGGLFGFGLRAQMSKNAFFETGFHYRPILIFSKDFQGKNKSLDIRHSQMWSGGFSLMTPLKWSTRQKKYRSNGAAFHVGHSFGYPTNFGAVGLVWETQRRFYSRQSFVFELGIGAYQEKFRDKAPFYEVDAAGEIKPLFYFKLFWNRFFVKQKPK